MRRLVSFDNPDLALALSEVLYAANIDSDVRAGDGNESSVWVLTERDLPRAEAILRAFVAQPPRGPHASVPAPPKVVAKQTLMQRARESPITYGLIAICVVVGVVTELGTNRELLPYLTIASFERSADMLRWAPYRDLLHGEVWRLITPIFIHFGFFHLLFNAFWMSDLGGPTERFQGRWQYTAFVLWSAAVSNSAQLVFGHSPMFGGMSGVVYAYVGYLWARGRADPRSGIFMPGRMVGFFVAWMALGFSGLLDSVVGAMANYCHLGGFLAGAAYGYVAALIVRRRA
ncbi:MAG TPA: rhomboid family intramembrane serine protease [Polyangiales bacterium]|nr:rhomboid family intramembrane serine protease [Polyangiales bacterium]